jgi:hypothetical protein
MKKIIMAGLVAGGIATLAGCNTGRTLDLKTGQLEKAIKEQVGTPVHVKCPGDIPIEKGKITDCTVSDGRDRKILRVTQDDDEGHYTWEITSQDAS